MIRWPFVIAAHRLPYQVVHTVEEGPTWGPAPGGLVGSLLPVAKDRGSVWVGGAAEGELDPDSTTDVPLVPVRLTPDELRDDHDGFSSTTVWPLYHDVAVTSEFDEDGWQHYVSVNRKVVNAIVDTADVGATVWIQDYQLQLAPRMLRKLRPDVRIGFFLHIPFPPAELFRQLPWRRQLLLGLLGADLIGFQSVGDARNFGRSVGDHLGCTVSSRLVTTRGGRSVHTRVYPVAVDSAALVALATAPSTQRRMGEMSASLGHPRQIFLGIDRLDYTKGLGQRIQAFAELYADGALDPATVSFIQLITPSRERTEAYRSLRREVDRLVGNINGRYGHLGRSPVTYLSRYLPRSEVVALHRLADVMVVTPLRGGMSLVAKEYVACRTGDDGALVLSEFAGAAHELHDAYLVNPYDIDALKAVLLQAATDSAPARAQRMYALRRQVKSHDVHGWATRFLDDLVDVTRTS